MFESITRKPFWTNLLFAISLVVFVFLVFFLSLSFLTKHGESAKVPYVTGMRVEDATVLLISQGFRVEIQDSVYVDTAAVGSVINQTPDGEVLVKSGRTIYLTINRTVAPLVSMPDLRGFSFLSAKLYLKSVGLKLGDTSYTPDIAKNVVREQLLGGQPIAPGTKINMSSTIDLVLGSGVGDADVDVPNVVGMMVAQAREYVSHYGISVSAVIAEGSISDTINSYVIRQNPVPYTIEPDGSRRSNKIKPGQLMDIWISKDAPDTSTHH